MADPLNAYQAPAVNYRTDTDERLQLVIMAARIGTWDYNPLTDELSWSDRCKELFGLRPDSPVPITYDLFLQGLHPDDRSQTNRVVENALQPENIHEPFQVEYRTIGLDDGQVRWIRSNGRAFLNDAGQVDQFIGTVIDITQNYRHSEELERRVHERTLALQEALRAKEEQEALARQSNKALNQVLEGMPINTLGLTSVRDESGRIIDFHVQFVNNLSAINLGFSREQLIGRLLSEVSPGYRETLLFRQYVDTVESGELHRSEIQTGTDDTIRWYDVSSVKQDDGLLVMYLNITDRKQSEHYIQQQTEELQRNNFELRQSNENLQQFAQVASHDLQEPLRRIQAFSDILQNQFEDNLSDGERDMIRRIQKSAGRMQLLIKDLLVYSRLATHRDPFELVSLNDVLTDVRSDLEIVIAEKQARIHVEPLPTVMGNDSRLRQLFQNLVANALKFQKPGQQPVIGIQARPARPQDLPERLAEQEDRRFWLITVTDNGLGFDEKYKDRIFTPFQRLHDGSAYGGTGIGLAICYRVTESHGGAIDVSSQPGEGATFKVFLPM
ncbi:sensor histidine kinase [Spirosoma sp. KUDC1026]|uniref:sensor histidine kinase n=1 Tax=Spirosoma sp. KUDC1026 TaxID=2745947 RepID=UPI00159BE51F|nr:ATP-binding protein [Spirosoma sp. KUDC1026]QKZ14007.1 PAS domain-containing protein [Spirosoma sp. KUDC1026]